MKGFLNQDKHQVENIQKDRSRMAHSLEKSFGEPLLMALDTIGNYSK